MRLRTKPIPNPLPERSIRLFWSYVDKSNESGCWLWTGSTNDGYGRLYIGKRAWLAHRISFVIANGPLPDECEVIRHSCDTPLCVNPAHLSSGSIDDNVRDRQEKERQARGETNHFAKLTEAQVAEIRRRYVPYKVTLPMLAAEFGICERQVWVIAKGRGWKHLDKETVPCG
jgi:hypothetical protein